MYKICIPKGKNTDGKESIMKEIIKKADSRKKKWLQIEMDHQDSGKILRRSLLDLA